MRTPGPGQPTSGHSGRAWPLRLVLLTIVALSVMPPLVFSGIMLTRYADSERERARFNLQQSARALARSVDAEFAAVDAALHALASSPSLANEDLAAFDRRLRAVAALTGRAVELLAADGRSASSPLDTSRSATTAGATSAGGATAGNTSPAIGSLEVSNVIIGPGGVPTARVTIPVMHGGAVRWKLQAIVYGKEFEPLVAEPGVPGNWIVSIVDRNGVHLIRSHKNSEYAGKPVVPVIAEKIRERWAGVVDTTSLEGIELVSTIAYARSSGWAVAMGLPRSELDAPLRTRLWDLSILGLFLAVLALGAGLLMASTLDRSIASIGRMARQIGAGNVISFKPTRFHDVNELGSTLEQTSRELNQKSEALAQMAETLEDQVRARTVQLSETNERLKAEIDRRQSSEAQVQQLQKMEAVGQLTGGIAHDFNNMMAIVTSSLRLLQRQLERGESDVGKFVDGAMKGAESAVALVAKLLAFSRQQALEPRPTDANALLTGLEEIIRRTIREDVSINMALAADAWHINVDPNALENAIVNLAVNARDAMPGGGNLTIETANTTLDENYVQRYQDLDAGDYLLIAVTDTGIGMSADVVARAFEPFFTTKAAGEGTGLGLSQTYGFARQSGGHVRIYSEAGIGTTIRLYLPRYHGDLADPKKVHVSARGKIRQGSGQLVLVVEDEPDVRLLATSVLEEIGYMPITAECGRHALELLGKHPAIAVLLTDVVMPEMNGRQLADEALRRRPDLKVLFMSGYARDAIVHNRVLDPGIKLIGKPFSLEELAAKLADLLEAEQK